MLPRETALAALRSCPYLVVEDSDLAELRPGAMLLTANEVHRAASWLAAEMWTAGQFGDTALLDANYLRVPDAELAQRARQAALRPAGPDA